MAYLLSNFCLKLSKDRRLGLIWAFLELLSRDSKALHKVNREIFHLGNSGSCSWAEFAAAILKEAKCFQAKVQFVGSNEVARPAKRPLNSVLSIKKAEERLGMRMRPWSEAVADFLTLMNNEEKLRNNLERILSNVRNGMFKELFSLFK